MMPQDLSIEEDIWEPRNSSSAAVNKFLNLTVVNDKYVFADMGIRDGTSSTGVRVIAPQYLTRKIRVIGLLWYLPTSIDLKLDTS